MTERKNKIKITLQKQKNSLACKAVIHVHECVYVWISKYCVFIVFWSQIFLS